MNQSDVERYLVTYVKSFILMFTFDAMSRQEIPYKLRLGNVNIQVERVERVVHLIVISFSMT